MIEIVPAVTQVHFQAVGALMTAYVAWDADQTSRLGLDSKVFLDFYYGDKPEELPGEFGSPGGMLLLATLRGQAAGCVGFRRLTAEACELKRMYVRPECRGEGLGRRLVTELLDGARQRGYREMKLETVSFMPEAQKLYQSLGFEYCAAYYEIPEGLKSITSFMRRAIYE